MGFTNDPVADFERHDRECQKWLDSLPKCVHCKEPIQDDYYFEIEGETICTECLFDYCLKHHKKENFQ